MFAVAEAPQRAAGLQFDPRDEFRVGGDVEQSVRDGEGLAISLGVDLRFHGPDAGREPQRASWRAQRERLLSQLGGLIRHGDEAFAGGLLQCEDRFLVVLHRARAEMGNGRQGRSAVVDDVAGAGPMQCPSVCWRNVRVHGLTDQVVREEHCVFGAAEQPVVDAFARQNAHLSVRRRRRAASLRRPC